MFRVNKFVSYWTKIKSLNEYDSMSPSIDRYTFESEIPNLYTQITRPHQGEYI